MIKICRSNPVVVDASGTERSVRGPAAVLLRVLLLAPDPVVPVDAAVVAIGKQKTGFGTYCEQIRAAFADKNLIVRSSGTIKFAGSRDDVDASIVRAKYARIVELVDPIGSVDDDDRTEFNAEVASQILPLIEEIEDLYDGTPALGLTQLDWVDFPEPLQTWAQALTEVASEWMTLWTSLQLLAADCRLVLRPGKKTGIELVTNLLKIARTPDPVEEVWPRLLRAADMSQNLTERQRVWQLMEEFFTRTGMVIPDQLRRFSPPPPTVANTPTSPHRPHPLDSPLEPPRDGLNHLQEIAKVLGITTASTLRLRGEIVDPMECILRTNSVLYFSGVLASKWVMDPGVRNAFDDLLTRLDALPEKERDVRFLIMDPDGDAYSQLYQLRGGRLSSESVPHLRELARRHPSFKVGTVDALPSFRIVVIDDDMVSFSPYALEGERYATSKLGWDAPHVLLDPRAPYPLAEAFRLYFEERWENARPL